MKKRNVYLILMIMAFALHSQTTSTYLNAKQAAEISDVAKSGVLHMIIENEKAPLDAALVEAVKNNWSVNKVKYMSLLEFTDKFKNKTLDIKNLYLFNNFNNVFGGYANGRTTLGLYNGYYLTNDPVKLMITSKASKAPPYLYFSANVIGDAKGNINKGYFDLMAKNFNYEVEYCMKTENFTTKKKYKRKNEIIFIKDQSEFKDKTVLLVKEQVEKTKIDKKSKKKQENKFVTEQYTNSNANTHVVFPEDIEYAIKKKDDKVMLYNGGNLYSPVDGSVYATTQKQKSPPYVRIGYSVASLVVSIVLIAFVLSN